MATLNGSGRAYADSLIAAGKVDKIDGEKPGASAAMGDQPGMGSPLISNGEMMLYGTVGSYWGDGFSAADVLAALNEIGRANDVTVHINSGGGDASEGATIFNALKAHRGKVSVSVDGMAASAASIIAMAGNPCTMQTGAVMMIHDPAAMTIGTASDHGKAIEMLDSLANGFADIYAEKSGKTPAECRADMQAETWLTAEQAIAAGYADAADAAPAAEPAAFNYRMYRQAPEPIVAMADARGWTSPRPRGAAARRAGAEPLTRNPAAAAAATEPRGAAAHPPVDPGETTLMTTEAEKKIAADAKAAATTFAADIIAAATAAGVPAMAAALIKEEGLTLDQAKARIASAKEIRAAVAFARKTCPAIDESLAEGYIAAGTPMEKVRADLFARQADAAAANPTTAAHAAGAGAGDEAALWGKVTAKLREERGETRRGKAA